MDRFPAIVVTVTPNMASFATPYSSGDVIGSVTKIPNALLDMGYCAKLLSVVVLDAANQKSALDFVFFTQTPANSIGADNSPYALNDADLLKVCGRFSVLTADYVSSGTNNAEATKTNIKLLLEGVPGSRDLYMAVISRGTPTYGSASDLSIKLGLEQE